MGNSFFIDSGSEQLINAIHQEGSDRNRKIDTDRNNGKPLTILLHGYPGDKSYHGGLFATVAAALAIDGMDTVRFDFKGCGESGGKPEEFSFATASEDISSVLDWAQESGYGSFFFIAEGLGAPAALMNMPSSLKGMALLWPALDPRHTRTIREALNAPASRISPALLRDVAAYNPLQALRNIDLPLLVQHGDADDEIPPIQLELLRRYATSDRRIEVTTYEGGTHGLPQPSHRKTALLHIRRFIARYAA